jgi:hypothetical protein
MLYYIIKTTVIANKIVYLISLEFEVNITIINYKHLKNVYRTVRDLY